MSDKKEIENIVAEAVKKRELMSEIRPYYVSTDQFREQLTGKLQGFFRVEEDGPVIKIDPLPGAGIEDVTSRAFHIALSTGRLVRFRFNGVEITAMNLSQ